jgi:2-polyprenyl-3-methyl-5-hydroxy-6-metoxy-1,4-benzoquinol methylase
MSTDFQSAYLAKPENYFGKPRLDIVSLLPRTSEKVLEIGCGTGATLKFLKDKGICAETYGVEFIEEVALKAKEIVDHVMIGSIEQDTYEFADKKFDLILILDVLEHLFDPWTILQRVVRDNLNKNGVVIISIPNVRFYNVVLPLVIKGRWVYQESGVLDRTHIRFFTRESALELINSANLRSTRTLRNPVDISTKRSFLNRVTLNLFSDFMTQQYIFRAEKNDLA